MTHAQFLLKALALSALVGGGTSWLLPWLPVGGRRPVALVGLGLPVLILALATAHTIPRLWSPCAAPAGWDRLATLGVLFLMWGSAAGAVGVSAVRISTAQRILRSCPGLEDPQIRARLQALAGHVRLPTPELRVLERPSPLSAAGWLHRPAVVVSRWLLEHLDPEELQAVLAHELAHLARRAPQVLWVARLLRDATWYLPSAWYALRVLEAEEELTADALAVEMTHRPLPLTSALAKVVEHTLRPSSALAAFGPTPVGVLEERLTRLLEGQVKPAPAAGGMVLAGGVLTVVAQVVLPILATAAGGLPLYCRFGAA